MPNTNTAANTAYRIAIVDIENAPNIGYTWGRYEQNVIAFEEEWYMLSFAVKWVGDKRGQCFALPDFPLYKTEPTNDRELVKKLREVLDEADLVIGHNILDFDIRKANSRMIYHGLTPPSPYKTVDTLKLARSNFMLNSNKLDDLGQYLGVGEKVETGGFSLWLGCMYGDELAWKRMKKYNLADVELTEKVYMRLRAWHNHHPNITLATGQAHLCPVCGSKTERRGWRPLKSYRARSYHCLNKTCGKYSQGEREKLPVKVLS